MRFCEKCENMLYLNINDETAELTYSCRYCGDVQTGTVDEHVVHRVSFENQSFDHLNVINQYTKDDPTIPITTSIPCPMAECDSNKEGGTPKLRYVRHDKTNLKYSYMCMHCGHVWRSQ